MATFLELWGNGSKNARRPMPTIDPSYLAIAYNHEVGSGRNGTNQIWLPYVVATYGAVPIGAVPASSRHPWPWPDWERRHERLMAEVETREILGVRFQHASYGTPFTGTEYVRHLIGLDFRDFRFLASTWTEPYQPSAESDRTYDIRAQSWEALSNRLQWRVRGAQMASERLFADPDSLYESVVSQLRLERPVLLAINTHLIEKGFSSYRVIGKGDLLDEGKGSFGSHAVVAVGHCDDADGESPLCREFSRERAERSIPECLVLQNSWGETVHAKGYLCISQRALRRMLLAATLLKKVVP